MNSVVQHPTSVVTQSDRFSLTVFLALAFHAVVILGITFDLFDPEASALNTMEVTLVHNKSDDAPEDADYLAQANQKGGGNIKEKVRDSSPFSNPVPTSEKGFAPHSRLDFSPPVQDSKPQEEFMTVERAKKKTRSKPLEEPLPVEKKTVTAAQLFERSQQIARMAAELKELKQAYQQAPYHTYMTGANAREYRFASYLDAWRAKVEKYGNINYPSEAIYRNLNGRLLLDVAINADGSVHSVKVLRTSGHRVLDEAAKRIVRGAAPYPPLTKDILQDTHILHIPRVWTFKSGSGLTTSLQ
ncbi:MAG: energy transducer TonB [Gammaproteobacteria bacterium]|jgi:protein TonB